MISKQKYIVTLVIIIGLLSVIYFNASQSDELKKSVPQSGISSNTGKILNIASQSGQEWKNNPFGTGKPNSNEIQKLEFKKPNTEWKPRTLSGITYRFGEGNPREVAQLSEKEKEIYSRCQLNEVFYIMQCPPGPSYEGQGYIRADIEKDLLTLLTHPLWQPVLVNCEQQFRRSEVSVLDFEANYDRVMSGNYLSMENLLIIDDRNGRKILSNNFASFYSWFRRAMQSGKVELGITDFSRLNNCITQHGGFELFRLIDIIDQKQYHPLGNYPDRLIDPKKYIPR